MASRDGQGQGQPAMLSVVVPLFNERENLGELHQRLTLTLESLDLNYEIILVDDGSVDETPALLARLRDRDARVVVVTLSRNFGHQAAVCAGLDHARGDAVVVMDGDLQDPPEVLPRLVGLWREGFEVVYAVRKGRKEPFWKRLAYAAFYRILRAVSDLDIPLDSGDFCLMDRKVVDVLIHLPEKLRFVRGLRTFVGFRQIGLIYERSYRNAGRSKYSVFALVNLAVDGLISLSSYPLHLVTQLGIVSAGAAALLTARVLADALTNGTSPRGWASTIVVVLVMGSVQLISLGIMGEYVRRIFVEVKGRPTYIVRDQGGRPGNQGRDAESARERRAVLNR